MQDEEELALLQFDYVCGVSRELRGDAVGMTSRCDQNLVVECNYEDQGQFCGSFV